MTPSDLAIQQKLKHELQAEKVRSSWRILPANCSAAFWACRSPSRNRGFSTAAVAELPGSKAAASGWLSEWSHRGHRGKINGDS